MEREGAEDLNEDKNLLIMPDIMSKCLKIVHVQTHVCVVTLADVNNVAIAEQQ